MPNPKNNTPVMNNRGRYRSTGVNTEEVSSKINHMRSIASQNHEICRERERFFFQSNEKPLLSAQEEGFRYPVDKIPVNNVKASNYGYWSRLRVRFVIAVLLFGGLIFLNSYSELYFQQTISTLKNLLEYSLF